MKYKVKAGSQRQEKRDLDEQVQALQKYNSELRELQTKLQVDDLTQQDLKELKALDHFLPITSELFAEERGELFDLSTENKQIKEMLKILRGTLFHKSIPSYIRKIQHAIEELQHANEARQKSLVVDIKHSLEQISNNLTKLHNYFRDFLKVIDHLFTNTQQWDILIKQIAIQHRAPALTPLNTARQHAIPKIQKSIAEAQETFRQTRMNFLQIFDQHASNQELLRRELQRALLTLTSLENRIALYLLPMMYQVQKSVNNQKTFVHTQEEVAQTLSEIYRLVSRRVAQAHR
jgi:uncharacterized protein (UPF0147 family)